MKFKEKLILLSFLFLFFSYLSVDVVSAHEAYVLSRETFQQGLQVTTTNPLAPLIHPEYLPATLVITLGVGALYLLNFLWAMTDWAAKLDKFVKKASSLGPFLVRLAIGAAFLYGAQANNIFGPEISLTKIPGGQLIWFLKVIFGATMLVGLFTEISALISLLIFVHVMITLGPYLLTYLNYLGELIALAVFGSRTLSLDRLFFGKNLWNKTVEKWKEWEIPLVRVMYGLALIYAAWSVKFVHSAIPTAVYTQYHLERFFHGPADYIVAGAGLSELAVGFFIMIGFAQRLTILISFIFISLSLLFFGEAVWPHLMLFGLSFDLFVNAGDKYGVDYYLVPWLRKARKSFFRN